MNSDEEKARKARAERLRKQIEQLKTPESDAPVEVDDSEVWEDEVEPQEGESPREFIHRRMHELDEGKKKKPAESSD